MASEYRPKSLRKMEERVHASKRKKSAGGPSRAHGGITGLLTAELQRASAAGLDLMFADGTVHHAVAAARKALQHMTTAVQSQRSPGSAGRAQALLTRLEFFTIGPLPPRQGCRSMRYALFSATSPARGPRSLLCWRTCARLGGMPLRKETRCGRTRRSRCCRSPDRQTKKQRKNCCGLSAAPAHS